MGESTNSTNTSLNAQSPLTDEHSTINKILDEMPEDLQKQMRSFLAFSKEAPAELLSQFNKTLAEFEAMAESDSEVRPLLPNGVTEETLAKELAKLPNSQEIIEKEQLEAAKLFENMYTTFAELEPESDMEVVREFANASSLGEVFAESMPDNPANFSDVLPDEAAELIHSALACQMAGLPKQAKLFYKLFTRHQFMNADKNYQSLQTDITKHKGHLDSQKSAAKKGGDKRQLPARKTKQQAIELFFAGEYKNYSVAASELFPQIKEIAASNNFYFNSDLNGLRTVTDWLRSTKRYSGK